MTARHVSPLRVVSRTSPDDFWVRIYAIPNTAKASSDPEAYGRELGRIHMQVVDDHPDGAGWLRKVLEEVGRSVSITVLDQEPTHYLTLQEGQVDPGELGEA